MAQLIDKATTTTKSIRILCKTIFKFIFNHILDIKYIIKEYNLLNFINNNLNNFIYKNKENN
jgi:hypothetical protein